MIQKFVTSQIVKRGLDERTEKAYRLDLEYLYSWIQDRGDGDVDEKIVEDYRCYLVKEKNLKHSSEKGWRHYFYGSTEETLDKLKTTLKTEYPGIQIVGMHSPPFRSVSEEEDRRVIAQINDTTPDFVWIGLGAPKQETWMAEHQGRVKGFMVGVGAAFDYLAGNIKRAPTWMQSSNMEWLYRLIQEPKRLFKRY